MQSGNERPGSGFRLPSQSSSPLLPLVVFIIGGFLALGLYRLVSTNRNQVGLPAYRPIQVVVVPPDHMVRGTRFRSVSRRASDQNSETPLLRAETRIDLSADVTASSETLEPSQLLAETTTDLNVDPGITSRSSQEDLQQINALDLETSDDLTIEQVEKIFEQLKKPASGLLGATPVYAREPFFSDFSPRSETTVFVSPAKTPLFEPLGKTDTIQETSTSITNLVTASSGRVELYREPFSTVVKYLLMEMKTGIPHTQIFIPPAETLTKQIKKDINKIVKANHAYVQEDLDMAREVYRLRLLPRDPEMDLIIKEIIRAQWDYQKIDKSASDFREKQEAVKERLRTFYSSHLPLTQSENLTAYFLAHYSGDSPFMLKRLERRGHLNEHHFVPPKKFGRIVYALDNSCHCFVHWIAYLETGEGYHITVAQSQNSLRYGPKLKSSSLPVAQLGSSSMRADQPGSSSTRGDQVGSTSLQGKTRN